MNSYTELEILFEISSIANRSTSFEATVDRVRSLLERQAGLHSLVVELFEPGAEARVSVREGEFDDLFALAGMPYKSLYSVPLRAGGADLGRLVAAFASAVFQGDVPRRIATSTGEQLGLLLERTRLVDAQRSGRRLLDEFKNSLSERKILSRAEGLLTSRHNMTQAAAERWITTQAAKTGLPTVAVAERLLLAHSSVELASTTGTVQRLSA